MQLLSHGLQDDHKAIVSIIDQLITAGVNVNHQNLQGDTALHYATAYAQSRKNPRPIARPFPTTEERGETNFPSDHAYIERF